MSSCALSCGIAHYRSLVDVVVLLVRKCWLLLKITRVCGLNLAGVNGRKDVEEEEVPL